MQRIFMIGWDGATFDLIHPWEAEGKLPNIARLLRTGTHGPLRSTLPPWTFPAWTSFMTGKNPGKHAIYDFFRPRPGTYQLEFVHGGHRRSLTFWQLLSQAGRSVVSISLPCTFPPDPVNGVMISGFDFPGEGPGSYITPRGIHPPELYDELNRTVGRHPIDAPIAREINEGRYDEALERIRQTIRQKAATARYLLQNKPWDCFMILFGESDGTAHQFWKFCDPHSPLFSAQPPGLTDSLLRIYQELDRQIGELLALLPPDTRVMMMSDHGFGGVSNWLLYPNRWLEERGLVRLRPTANPGKPGLLTRLKFWAVTNLPAWVQRSLYRFGGNLVGRLEARVRYATIDWAGSAAYFDENPYFPVLRVNLKGRQPQGTVEPGQPYEDLRDRLIRELRAWRHPQTGAPIVEQAYRREEVYSGPYVDQAPDVVVKWALHQGYSYAFRMSSHAPAGTWIEQVDPHQTEHLRFFTGKSGTHRDDGIFLAWGPGIRSGEAVSGARIIDLAPTILHLLDVPVPADMDGRVLEEILVDEQRKPVAAQAATGPVGSPPAPVNDGYSAEDEAKIAERLQSLGYME